MPVTRSSASANKAAPPTPKPAPASMTKPAPAALPITGQEAFYTVLAIVAIMLVTTYYQAIVNFMKMAMEVGLILVLFYVMVKCSERAELNETKPQPELNETKPKTKKRRIIVSLDDDDEVTHIFSRL